MTGGGRPGAGRGDPVERATRLLRGDPRPDAALADRIMARLPGAGAAPGEPAAPRPPGFGAPGRPGRRTPWSGRRGWAAAAALVLVFGSGLALGRQTAPRAGAASGGAGVGALVQFALVAPDARTVALVGDFNDWDATATPMARIGSRAPWVVDVPLPPGRHEYAFVVDGERWVLDAAAPRAPADELGPANSVVLVGGAT